MKYKKFIYSYLLLISLYYISLSGCTSKIYVDFSASPRTGTSPLYVSFTDNSQTNKEIITSWEWDFGDGVISTEKNPIHQYFTPGEYSVSLKISTNKSSSLITKYNYINIDCPAINNTTIENFEMEIIPNITFTQGKYWYNTLYHSVSLSSYYITAYEINNIQYCMALNMALSNNLVTIRNNYIYSNSLNSEYGVGNDHVLINLDQSYDYLCKIYYNEYCRTFMVVDGYENYPVVSVTWYGAVSFCNWLSQIHDLVPCYDLTNWMLINPRNGGYRLPSESEWECAAAVSLGGDGTVYEYKYATGTDSRPTSEMINSNGYYNMILPTGYFNGFNEGTILSKSPFGCYDMQGNVAEWCGDWFDPGYYRYCQSFGTISDPLGPDTKMIDRVVRDSSWLSGIHDTSTRNHASPDTCISELGFRIVKN